MLICASDTYAGAVPAGPMAWQPVLLRSWAPGDEAHFNAAAAAKMPPPREDAWSSSFAELGRSSGPLGGLVYVLFGLLPRRVLLDFSVFSMSSTTSSASATHMHAHCTRCASLSPL